VRKKDDLLTQAAAARILAVTPKTLERWRNVSGLRLHVKIGGKVRDRRSHVLAFKRERSRYR
jgi:Helix-turn-helix domain